MSLLYVLFALCVVMALAWACQRQAGNIGWVDVFWTFGTAAAGMALAFAWPAPEPSPGRRLLVCAVAAAWSLRLGLHIGRRVARSQEDGRYVELRKDWGAALQPRLFAFLQLQALVSTALAAAIGLAARRPGPLGLQDALGLAIALAAVIGETLADRQLQAFAADPGNRGQVCDRGLWAWSRHPNYLFEWLAWFAYPAIAIDISGAYPQGWWALAAPVLMFGVLRFGTGAPPLEAHMLRTRGDAFRAYSARVPIFLPRPPRRQERLAP